MAVEALCSDVFVPLDSSQSNQWVNHVWSGVMRTAVFAWMDDHRDAFGIVSRVV